MSIQRFHPEVRELPKGLTPHKALERLRTQPYCLLMESAMRHPQLGRYSFLMADPIETFYLEAACTDPLSRIATSLEQYATENIAGLPPFQGGWAGLLSYELGHSYETLPQLEPKFLSLPVAILGLYDVCLCWDHVLETGWLISQGIPETDVDSRKALARQRADYFEKLLSESSEDHEFDFSVEPAALPKEFVEVQSNVFTNFTQAAYHSAVESVVEFIRAGDIFQCNLSQQLMTPQKQSAFEVYKLFSAQNASTFAGYFDFGRAQIVSASPERLVSLRDRKIEARPIKGTRRKTEDVLANQHAVEELLSDPKELAENTMIVDLIRNDLSRVSIDASVQVSQFCEVEEYATVYHLVSAIEAEIAQGRDAVDLIEAMFPGGSVTGAPKIRAMEIISELERLPRGAYCGSLGYFGFGGNADFNILIRTATAQNGWWQIPAGGAIVVDSDPAREYAETWAKANALLDSCKLESRGRKRVGA
ncbi:MAG: anthranilate synthase component I family protein [Pirellulaceae bacterium]